MNIYPDDYESKYEFYLEEICKNKEVKKLFAEEATQLLLKTRFCGGEISQGDAHHLIKRLAYVCYLTLP